jgi:hypothetical protein
MSAAVCLLASLLSCPYPYTGARLQPAIENTQSIKRERLAIKRERMAGLPAPIVARFGPDERFGTTDLQIPIPFIFSQVDESPQMEDQEPSKKAELKQKAEPRPKVRERAKIIIKTTETKAVERAYTEDAPLEQQWRLSSLFGIRNAALSQPVNSVSGIEMEKPGYQEVIRAARMHQVPVDLALRVAKQESRGNCGAKSSAGALGVMQVMPRTGAKHGYSANELSNCRAGAEAGVKELKHLLSLSGGDIKQTLTGYNCGEKCMFGRRKTLPLETVNYIQVVTQN